MGKFVERERESLGCEIGMLKRVSRVRVRVSRVLGADKPVVSVAPSWCVMLVREISMLIGLGKDRDN